MNRLSKAMREAVGFAGTAILQMSMVQIIRACLAASCNQRGQAAPMFAIMASDVCKRLQLTTILRSTIAETLVAAVDVSLDCRGELASQVGKLGIFELTTNSVSRQQNEIHRRQ
jgi:hypothetical protein